jgi:hypothetical protein
VHAVFSHTAFRARIKGDRLLSIMQPVPFNYPKHEAQNSSSELYHYS